MKELPLKAAVLMQLTWVGATERARTMANDERGEIGSWMIVAAGLAAAAAAAIALIGPWIGTKAQAIVSN